MFITLGEQRIFFDVVGEKLAIDGPRLREKPTLLVLHGGPGFDHSGLRPAFDGFADVAQVVYLDHRGNGRSAPSDPATWTLAQWGDDVRAFCDALGIVKPIVFGQSFGGMVAQSYATRYPSHPGALILSSTAARMDLAASFDLFEARGGADARAIAERFWGDGDDDDFATYVRVCMPLYNPTTPVGGADSRARAIVRPDVFRRFSAAGNEIHRMDFRALLSRVTCPVLVLAGALDPMTPPHLSSEIARAIDPALVTLHVFENAGHGAFRDDPEPVFAEIRRFLAARA